MSKCTVLGLELKWTVQTWFLLLQSISFGIEHQRVTTSFPCSAGSVLRRRLSWSCKRPERRHLSQGGHQGDDTYAEIWRRSPGQSRIAVGGRHSSSGSSTRKPQRWEHEVFRELSKSSGGTEKQQGASSAAKALGTPQAKLPTLETFTNPRPSPLRK